MVVQSFCFEGFLAADGEAVKIVVLGLAGEICSIDAHMSWSVDMLKRCIAVKTGIPCYQQCLALNSEELKRSDMSFYIYPGLTPSSRIESRLA